MAAGDPVLVNLTGATFLMAAETGVIIQSADRDITSKLKEIFDASKGNVAGYVFYDFIANIAFNAILNGSTGLALAAPGVALTLANNASLVAATGGNGVSSGGVYVKDVKLNHASEELIMISGNAFQRAGVA